MTKAQLEDRFLLQFNYPPEIVAAAPGRINLIGEHTDYNDGFVLPASIHRQALVALRQNNLHRFRFIANDLDESLELAVEELGPQKAQWVNYLLGVVDQLEQRGHHIGSFDCSLTCDVPQGAGLSSSAAIESALVTGLNKLFNLKLDKWEMVRIGQGAENGFVGANTGILDQFASIFGEADTALLLDCRNLDVRKQAIKLPAHEFVVFNTGVKHNHVTSGYADRRASCERAVTLMQSTGWAGKNLRDLTPTDLASFGESLDEKALKRARFVMEENARVLNAVDQLEREDVQGFGESLLAGHRGLSNDYEVSCPESDAIVRFAERHNSCAGARQMGGGFGGCILCVVKSTEVDDFIDEAQQDYFNHFAISLEPLHLHIGPGARILD